MISKTSKIHCTAAILAAFGSRLRKSLNSLVESEYPARRVMGRPPRIPVWLSLDCSVVYFITICVEKRERVLDNPDILSAVETFCAGNPAWLLLSAVIMPDHLHALVTPRNRDATVTQFSAGLKRHVRRAVQAEWHWQEGVFDRLLRKSESAEAKWLYMRENPVRAGLVACWEAWPYSIGFRNLPKSPS